MPSPALRVLFVPASGPTGSGEYYRALTLARALRARRPGLETHVLLNRSAEVSSDPGLVAHALSDTPARADREVRALIDELRPALAVFDGSGRSGQLRAVRRAGGRVAWISNRPGRRRRAFWPHRLHWIDLHLMLEPGAKAPGLGPIERLMARLAPGAEQRFASAIAPAPAALPEALQALGRSTPAVFVSGGGGQRAGGRPVPEVFLEAAGRFRALTGHPTCVVLGPQYRGRATAPPGVELLQALSTEVLAALLKRARLVVAGAGYMLSTQVVLAARPCVMTATGGHDQPVRLARYANAGAVIPTALDAAAITAAAVGLFEDASQAAKLVEGLQGLGLRDDTARVAGWLMERLPD